MTPYQQGRKARTERISYEMNPYLSSTSLAERLAFSTWPVDAREWYEGWRDCAIGVDRDAMDRESLEEKRP